MAFNHHNLLAGTLDNQVEFFAPEKDMIMCVNSRRILTFEEFPRWVIDLVRLDMLENPCILKELNITEITNVTIYKYIYEMFGGVDLQADIDTNGKINHSEYFEAGMRRNIQVECGHLTKCEIEVLKLAHLPDKLIADKLFNSTDTILSHWQNIRRKTGLSNKTELAIWAVKKGII